jgi:hypothetical protein
VTGPMVMWGAWVCVPGEYWWSWNVVLECGCSVSLISKWVFWVMGVFEFSYWPVLFI